MKKIVASVVVLAVLLVCSPWFLGGIAESRVNHSLDEMMKKAPYIKIAENKWTRGWFHSEHLVTFEFVLPRLNLPRPAAATALADAAPPAAPELPPVAEAPKALPSLPTGPVRFSVRSDVTNGPLLGSSGIGLARMDSHLIIPEVAQKKLDEALGAEPLVQITTRLGFFGGGTTTLAGKARTIALSKFGKPDQKGSIAWDAFNLKIGIGRHADSYDISGRQPRMEVSGDPVEEHFVMTDLTIDGSGKRVTEHLYDGDMMLGIGKMSVTGPRTPFEIEAIKYGVGTHKKGDFMEYALKLGSGAIKAKQLDALGFPVKEVHYDMTVRHLHTATLEKLVGDLQSVYGKNLGTAGANPSEIAAAVMGPLKEHGIELIKHDPELALDRIGIVTADGEGVIKGLIRLVGVTDQDLAAGVFTLVPKIDADLTVEVAEALVAKVPNGNTVVGLGIDQGYLKRENGKLVSHIEFKQGVLKVNGKTPALPGGLPFGRGANPSQSVPPPQ